MSYKFYEDFSLHTERGESYSLFPEEITRYDIPDCKIDEKGFRILRKYVKQLLCTPNLSDFSLDISVVFEECALMSGKDVVEWSVFLGYSRTERRGKEIRLSYSRDLNSLTVRIFDVVANSTSELQSHTVESLILRNGIEYIFKFEVAHGGIKLYIENKILTLDTKIENGMIALQTTKGVEGIFFRSISVSSDNHVSDPISIANTTLTIPCLDGGEIDYTLLLNMSAYENGICRVICTLDGGVYLKKILSLHADCWSTQYEHMIDPYIRFIQNGRISQKYYLKNGALYFVANDYKNHDIESILNAEEMPYRVAFSGENISKFDAIAFGYAAKRTFGHEFYGGEREFVFSPDGNLIYDGGAIDTEYISCLRSSESKQITELIPDNIADREKAIAHAKNNHSFLIGEPTEFSAYLHTKKRANRIQVKAKLTDAFFRGICELEPSVTKNVEHVTDTWGYSTLKNDITVPKLAQGVYHICITWYYGDSVCHTHESAFEIIDPKSEVSPQMSAGLPLMYVGDGAPRDNLGALPDMWNKKSDFSIEHYFDCVQYMPDIAESKQPWELLKIYKRSTFVWLTERTVGDLDFRSFPLTVKNADYLYPTTADADTNSIYQAALWKHGIYKLPVVKKLFKKFRQTHPQFEHILRELPEDGSVTVQHLKSMMPYCFDEWTEFFNIENERIMTEQWNKIKALNPKIKRSSYGPFPLYGTNLSGGYHTKWFGLAPDSLSRVFNGFLQFEDYPFVCAYGTHYSAWGMMTIKHLAPDVKMAPELYDCFDAVCPDGFVAGAHPPLGESHAEPYMTVTQIYEYLYNTPILRENGKFSYWQDGCLMFYPLYMKEPEARMKQFLQAWGKYLENRPLSPKRSIAYLYEFDTADNRWETDVERYALYNICQSGEAYIHSCAAEAGLPAGFTVDYSSIEHLNADMTDVLVIPSLRLASDDIKKKIRELHTSGVALIATGDVSGLEDIFGVKKNYNVQHVTDVMTDNQREHVFPYDAEFFYAPDSAKTLLQTNGGAPVLMKTGTAVLLNCSVDQVGVDNYKVLCYYGRPNISKLLKETVSNVLCELCRPYAKADRRCGTTTFITENGDTDILLVDYSRYDDLSDKETYVEIFNRNVRDIECISNPDINIGKYFDGNCLKEFNVTMRHHEALLFKLKKDKEP